MKELAEVEFRLVCPCDGESELPRTPLHRCRKLCTWIMGRVWLYENELIVYKIASKLSQCPRWNAEWGVKRVVGIAAGKIDQLEMAVCLDVSNDFQL